MFVGKYQSIFFLFSIHFLLNRYYNHFILFCSDAAMMAMRRKITGRSPSEIKQIRREEVDLPVTEEDFNDAMARTRKSVSQSDVVKFEKWMEEYGSC